MVLGLWRVLKVFNILTHHFAVDDQITLLVNHVRNHKNLIELGVGKLEWQLGGFDIKRAHAHFAARQHFLLQCHRDHPVLSAHGVPLTTSYFAINQITHVVRHVVLTNIQHGVFVIREHALLHRPRVQAFLVCQRLVCRRRIRLFLVLGDDWHDFSANIHHFLIGGERYF